MAAGVERCLAQWLTREQIVAEIDRIERSVAPAMSRKPALRRLALAILLLRAVLRDDEFRLQRDDFVMTGCHERRSQHGVVILDIALAPEPTRAVLAVNGLRTMILRAIERDQHMAAQPAEHIQATLGLPKLLDDLCEHRMQQIWRRRVQHVPDMIVARDLRQPEQRLAVGSPVALLEPPLMRQERRALHEKHRERCHPDVAHRILRVQATALVGKTLQASPQTTKKRLERSHALHQSHPKAFGNPLSRARYKLYPKLWHSGLTPPHNHPRDQDSFSLRTAGPMPLHFLITDRYGRMANLIERKSLKLLAQAGQTLNQIIGEGLCDEPQKQA